jgi:hypothetical protein
MTLKQGPRGYALADVRRDGMVRPATQELVDTVTRMEARLSGEPRLRDLWSAYRAVASRFEADLKGAARDIALAKSAALMLLQQVLAQRDADSR